MICPIDTDGYCERHKTTHKGYALHLALEDSIRGERFRATMDKVTHLPPRPEKSPETLPASGLGTMVHNALSAIGVTPERVTAFLGVPCGCVERRQRMDQLWNWASEVISGKVEGAKRMLAGIFGKREEEI